MGGCVGLGDGVVRTSFTLVTGNCHISNVLKTTMEEALLE